MIKKYILKLLIVFSVIDNVKKLNTRDFVLSDFNFVLIKIATRKFVFINYDILFFL